MATENDNYTASIVSRAHEGDSFESINRLAEIEGNPDKISSNISGKVAALMQIAAILSLLSTSAIACSADASDYPPDKFQNNFVESNQNSSSLLLSENLSAWDYVDNRDGSKTFTLFLSESVDVNQGVYVDAFDENGENVLSEGWYYPSSDSGITLIEVPNLPGDIQSVTLSDEGGNEMDFPVLSFGGDF